MTKKETLYNAYVDTGFSKNEDLMRVLDWSNAEVRQTKLKLKRAGFIEVAFDGTVKVIKPFREEVDSPSTYKAEVYREMLDFYMEDFRQQVSFKDRVADGQEIRLILKMI